MSIYGYSCLKFISATCLLLIVCLRDTSSPTPFSHSESPAPDNIMCEPPSMRRHRENKIHIGVILPFSGDYYYSLDLVRPALEHALKYVYSNTSLLRNYTIEFDYRDSKCSEIYGPLEAIDMYIKKSADLFLGPACDYAIAVVSRFTRFWEVPIISAGALVAAFSKKDIYGLLTRMMGSFDKLAEFVLSMLLRFHYKQIGMMVYTNKDELQGKSQCWFTLEPIYMLVRLELNSNLTMKYVETFDDDTDNSANFERSLKELSKRSRGEVNVNKLG